MKRVRINKWQRGLVFNQSEELTEMLTEGIYWFAPWTKVIISDITKEFIPFLNINIFLQNNDFRNNTTLVEVGSNEIVLKFEDKIFKEVMLTGKYIFWNGLTNYEFVKIDLNKIEIDNQINKSLLTKKELLPYVRTFVVEPYEKAVLYIDGKFDSIINSGTYNYWKNATTIIISRADLRTLQLEISGQEILTKDKSVLRLNFYIQYAISDINKAIVETKDYEKQLYVLMQLVLREFVGGFTLDELLDKKEGVFEYITKNAIKRIENLGVEIKNCGIRDIILPGEMKEIMNQVLIAEKKAQANTIMRREETASTRSLLNTAKLMEENAMLLKLKEMEYVEKIAEKVNTISLSGGNQVFEQLKNMFIVEKK